MTNVMQRFGNPFVHSIVHGFCDSEFGIIQIEYISNETAYSSTLYPSKIIT